MDSRRDLRSLSWTLINCSSENTSADGQIRKTLDFACRLANRKRQKHKLFASVKNSHHKKLDVSHALQVSLGTCI